MYVYEIFDHQKGRVVGIYTSLNAAHSKLIETLGTLESTRYKIWPKYVNDIIYDEELDCMYPQSVPEPESYDDWINAKECA